MKVKKKNCNECGSCVLPEEQFNDACACESACEEVNSANMASCDYGYYSKILKEPFESLDALKKAEHVYHEALKEKENKAAQKKADAQRVEDAFKALNAARKAYKENLIQLTKEYGEELDKLKKAFDLGKRDIQRKLAEAEDAYSTALKEFTAKHNQFHLTLRDGDFETTVSGSHEVKKPATVTAKNTSMSDFLDWFLSL